MSFSYKLTCLDTGVGGNILDNFEIKDYILDKGYNNVIWDIFDMSTEGSVVFSSENDGKRLLLLSGVHGNELSSQMALLNFIDDLLNGVYDLSVSLYVVPFLVPYSIMMNSRYFGSLDLNRLADTVGFATNTILDFSLEKNISAIGDFHTTDPVSFLAKNSVYCSVTPSIESCRIAEYIGNCTDSDILPVHKAGSVIGGSVEDVANLKGIPAVTCEVVSPIEIIQKKSVDLVYEQIISFLKYFNALS
ncbi:MAG: deacylase [Methanobacteriaceae archaeon]|nr:deacylase [Methanobacteriaceae archaeon]